jgi:hypothetical protein
MVVGAWFFLWPNENGQPITFIHLLTGKHKKNLDSEYHPGMEQWNSGMLEYWFGKGFNPFLNFLVKTSLSIKPLCQCLTSHSSMISASQHSIRGKVPTNYLTD